jgi:hypothetical protein
VTLEQILDATPRLRAWAAIGPVQRAELIHFAQQLLDQQVVGITCDGVGVEPGTKVYVFSSTGGVQSTTVQEVEALTDYYLHDNIPVAHSFSTREAAEAYRRENL